MKTEQAYEALRETAKQHGVSFETVWEEIEEAIAIGRKHPDPKIQAFWSAVPCAGTVPTPAEVVAYLSEKAVYRSSRK